MQKETEKTDLPQTDIADKAEKPEGTLGKSIRAFLSIVACLFLLDMAAHVLSGGALPHYFINDDRINIHMYERNLGIGFLYLMGRSGYEIRFGDIEEITLLPYSARQLGRIINDLYVPAPTGGRHRRFAVARYSGRYRLHVRLDEAASPTLWVTRRASVPVLISFRDSSRTEALFSSLSTAWRQYLIRQN